MNRLSSGYALGILLTFGGVGFADEPKATTPDLSLVNDGKTFKVVNADAEITKKDGEPTIVNLKVKAATYPDKATLALDSSRAWSFRKGPLSSI